MHRIAPERFAGYGVDEDQVKVMRARFGAWASELRSSD